MKRRTIAGAAVAAAIGLVLVRVPPGSSQEPIGSSRLPVAVVEVEMRDSFRVEERLAGRVVSKRSSELGFERGGRLAAVVVQEGDRVEAGALLASLDTRDLEAQRREIAAGLEASRARLELAKVTLGRRQELRDAEYLAAQGLDEAVATERAARADLGANRAALERMRVALDLSELRAPYEAIVTRRHLDEGTIASPGQSVLRVVEAGAQELRVGVPPELAASLDARDEIRVEVGGRSATARLVSVVPSVDATTRTQTAILEIGAASLELGAANLELGEANAASGEPLRIADGSLGHVRFEREVAARGCWLPITALSEGRRGTWTAFAAVDDEAGGLRTERRQVEVIHVGAERAFVRGTLSDGDRIIASGVQRLVPGLAVEVVPGTPTQPAGSGDSSSNALRDGDLATRAARS